MNTWLLKEHEQGNLDFAGVYYGMKRPVSRRNKAIKTVGEGHLHGAGGHSRGILAPAWRILLYAVSSIFLSGRDFVGIIEAANSVKNREPVYKEYYYRKYDEVPKHKHKRALVVTAKI